MLKDFMKKLCRHDWERQKRTVMLPISHTRSGTDEKGRTVWEPSRGLKPTQRTFRKCQECGRVERQTTKASGLINPRMKLVWKFFRYEDIGYDPVIQYEDLVKAYPDRYPSLF